MAKLVESRHSGCRVSVKVAILTGYAISTSRPNVFAGTCHEDRNMTLQHLTLDQIDQAQLQRLIDGKTSERQTSSTSAPPMAMRIRTTASIWPTSPRSRTPSAATLLSA